MNEGGGGKEGDCNIAKHEGSQQHAMCSPASSFWQETGLGGAIFCGGGVRGSLGVLVDGGDQTHHSSQSGSCPVVF